MDRKHVVVFVGAPACGKGTQITLLQEVTKAKTLSMSALLAQRATRGDTTAAHIKDSMETGSLVNDRVTAEVFFTHFAELRHPTGIIIVDGFPRTLSQYHDFMHCMWRSVNCLYFVHLDVYDIAENEIYRRLCERMTKRQRQEEKDHKEICARRIDLFQKDTLLFLQRAQEDCKNNELSGLDFMQRFVSVSAWSEPKIIHQELVRNLQTVGLPFPTTSDPVGIV